MKEIKQLLKITHVLSAKYNRKFTLDGKLVGDIGEVLVKEKYGLNLYKENEHIHDGWERETERKVQIKSSFRGASTFPYGKEKMPDYIICIQILENGEFDELYNGPGVFLFENYVKNLKCKNKNFYSLSKGPLKRCNALVSSQDKIMKVSK